MSLQEKMNELTPKQLDFVKYRIGETSDAPAYRAAGYNKQSWYRLPEDTRIKMKEVAATLAHDTRLRAIQVYQDEIVNAAGRVIMLSKTAENENVKLKANLDIIQRGGFRDVQQVDHTTDGETIAISIDF